MRTGIPPTFIWSGTSTVDTSPGTFHWKGSRDTSAGAVASTGSTHVNRAFHTDAALTTPLPAATFDLTTVGNDLYIDDGAGGSFLAIEGGAGTGRHSGKLRPHDSAWRDS